MVWYLSQIDGDNTLRHMTYVEANNFPYHRRRVEGCIRLNDGCLRVVTLGKSSRRVRRVSDTSTIVFVGS